MFGVASSVTSASSSARTRNAWRSSSSEIVRTRTPRFGVKETRPVAASRRSASRIGRAADAEPLGELFLPQDDAGRQLAGDDRVLERERDLVGLGAARVLA